MAVGMIGDNGTKLVGKQNALVQIVAQGSANAGSGVVSYGAWSEVLASTAAEYFVVGASVFSPLSPPSNRGYATILLDVGIGGSGSETALGTTSLALPDIDTTARVGSQVSFPVPARVAAGSRVSIRLATSEAEATPPFDVWLWLVLVSAVEGN
jgi:hypothetical protein